MADTDSAAEEGRQEESRSPERRPRPRHRDGDGARHRDGDGDRHRDGAPRAAKRPVGTRPRRAEEAGQEDERRSQDRGGGSPRRMNGPRAAGLAATFLADLTGKEFEGIVGIRKSGDDWSVEGEVLEMRRIPSTTDVLAVYEVTVDADGELVGYERRARYVRGDAREERE